MKHDGGLPVMLHSDLGRPGTTASRGFTLIEILVSIFLTVIVTMLVLMMYRSTMDTFRTAERELQWLAAFRSATDKMERELGSMVWKATYRPAEGENTAGWQPAEFKPVGFAISDKNSFPGFFTGGKENNAFLMINFQEKYIGFYTSLDARHIDRVEYYFNPPEKKLEWNNGEDDDNDNPTEPKWRADLGLLVDDKGSFMQRKTPDAELTYHQGEKERPVWSRDYLPGLSYIDPIYPPAFVLDPTVEEPDFGDILSDGIHDLKFTFIYLVMVDDSGDVLDYKSFKARAKAAKPVFKYACKWPFDNDDDWSKDCTGLQRGSGRTGPKGLSYLTPPLAVQVDFIFKERGFEKTMSKLIYLYGSLWNKWYLDPDTISTTNAPGRDLCCP